MTLAIDIRTYGLSNKVGHELLPKMSKVMLYLSFVSQYKAFSQLYITNKLNKFYNIGYSSQVTCYSEHHKLRVAPMIGKIIGIGPIMLFNQYIGIG